MNPNSQSAKDDAQTFMKAHVASYVDGRCVISKETLQAVLERFFEMLSSQRSGPYSAVASESLTDEQVRALTSLPQGPIQVVDSQDAKDAARYRWLRDNSDPDDGQPYVSIHATNSWGKWFNTCERGEKCDRVVDRAMSGILEAKPDAT